MNFTKLFNDTSLMLALLHTFATSERKLFPETIGELNANRNHMYMPIGRFQAAEFNRKLAELHGELAQTARKIGIQGVNWRWEFTAPEDKIEAERQRMIAEVRRRKLPGANLSGTWKVNTLFDKLIISNIDDIFDR